MGRTARAAPLVAARNARPASQPPACTPHPCPHQQLPLLPPSTPRSKRPPLTCKGGGEAQPGSCRVGFQVGAGALVGHCEQQGQHGIHARGHAVGAAACGWGWGGSGGKLVRVCLLFHPATVRIRSHTLKQLPPAQALGARCWRRRAITARLYPVRAHLREPGAATTSTPTRPALGWLTRSTEEV